MTQELASSLREERFQGESGLNIFFRSWRPATQARAVVVIIPDSTPQRVHQWVAEQLTAGGLAVYAVDLRGRGQPMASASTSTSSRTTSMTPRIWWRSRRCAIAAAGVSAGHSAGGVVSCLYTLEHQPELAASSARASRFRCPCRTSRWPC
jgi:alpha-beta hydrolase superfamily lysophospholipase